MERIKQLVNQIERKRIINILVIGLIIGVFMTLYFKRKRDNEVIRDQPLIAYRLAREKLVDSMKTTKKTMKYLQYGAGTGIRRRGRGSRKIFIGTNGMNDVINNMNRNTNYIDKYRVDIMQQQIASTEKYRGFTKTITVGIVFLYMTSDRRLLLVGVIDHGAFLRVLPEVDMNLDRVEFFDPRWFDHTHRLAQHVVDNEYQLEDIQDTNRREAVVNDLEHVGDKDVYAYLVVSFQKGILLGFILWAIDKSGPVLVEVITKM